MKNSERSTARLSRTPLWKKASLALLTSTLLLSGASAQMMSAVAEPLLVSQRQQGWNCVLNTARLINEDKMVLQLDVLDKPETTYANAVYQVFVRQGERWVEAYTSKGARLVQKSKNRYILAPEVISLKDLEKRLDKKIDWSRAEIRTVALLRYDARGERRDQRVVFEKTQRFSEIAQTRTTEIVAREAVQEVVYEQERREEIRESNRRDQEGNFSLAVLQQRATLSDVIARVSVQSRVSNGFEGERFIGDYKYKVNKRAKFVKGLKAGDRVVVRLFTPQNRLIGYSAFELLSRNSVVNLVLSDRVESGIVRTVYGVDSNQDYRIDQRVQVYDYFTQVSQVTRWSDARVSFFRDVRSINVRNFQYAGLPSPRTTCVYPDSLRSGSFSLVSRVVRVFYSGLASAITATPGQLVQIVNVSTTNVSIYEVTQLFVTYRTVGISQGVIRETCDLGCIGQGGGENDDDDDDNGGDDDNEGGDDDDDDDGRKKPKKRNCNQGIGNGAEGCDPGNSRPHGGSNDEGGRRPGNKK